eukprot:scaffold373080_cov29-Prasinocladus_malaysianus.AAC.1
MQSCPAARADKQISGAISCRNLAPAADAWLLGLGLGPREFSGLSAYDERPKFNASPIQSSLLPL